MSRVYNFSAGPAMLPELVLERAKADMLEYKNTGQSVMEMSHRSPEFFEILNECKTNIMDLLQISSDYHVLFIQGGAFLQFSMIPLNLSFNKVQIIDSGEWTRKAFIEHQKVVNTEIVCSSEKDTYSYIPKTQLTDFDQKADYLYICQNNTIFGTKYSKLPECGSLPLVSDVSSMIFSEPMDISKYNLLFAGTQKNMGMAGVCVVILKKSWFKEKRENLPSMLNYQNYINTDSLFNTPPTYALYLCNLVCLWLKEKIGGLSNMQNINQEKAGLLYDFLDESKFFKSLVNKEDRSLMNITFACKSKELDLKFVNEATNKGLINLAGHRIAGGMRASLYNGMPLDGVKTLIDFMKDFEVQYG